MNKLIFSLLVISNFALSQKIKPTDTIINPAYTAYINSKIKMPVYVKYKLYMGGGDCERSSRWINDSKYSLISDTSYLNTGYDRGHLVPAEDFAYNCSLEKLTFTLYNRLPQTKELNRGPWKARETATRNLSQRDSLLIFCGGYWDSKKTIIVKGMIIPVNYWKVIYDLTTNLLISVEVFTNTTQPISYTLSLKKLEKMLGYSLNISIPVKKVKTK